MQVTTILSLRARLRIAGLVGFILLTRLLHAAPADPQIQQLEAIAQNVVAELRAADARRSTEPAHVPAPDPLTAAGVELTSEEGAWFVGHQLDAFLVSPEGVIEARKPSWISLYRTEARDFTVSGEVSLGGSDSEMIFPDDLPDGFALFLREWDGIQRYQLDSRRILVKRRLMDGKRVDGIEVAHEFPEAPSKSWIPFRVAVSAEGIEYAFDSKFARVKGPLDTDGANKIAIAPGTKLRAVRVSVRRAPSRSTIVAATERRGSDLPAGGRPPATTQSEAPVDGDDLIVNGGFEELAVRNAAGDETGTFGETMFSAGSTMLRNWTVEGGPITWRDNSTSPDGGRVVELGPRDTPGCVSQTFASEAGARYQLSFHACTGRVFAHYNREVRVQAGDLDTVIACKAGSEYARVVLSFRAQGPTSTVKLCAVGREGFGPMVDGVAVHRLKAQ